MVLPSLPIASPPPRTPVIHPPVTVHLSQPCRRSAMSIELAYTDLEERYRTRLLYAPPGEPEAAAAAGAQLADACGLRAEWAELVATAESVDAMLEEPKARFAETTRQQVRGRAAGVTPLALMTGGSRRAVCAVSWWQSLCMAMNLPGGATVTTPLPKALLLLYLVSACVLPAHPQARTPTSPHFKAFLLLQTLNLCPGNPPCHCLRPCASANLRCCGTRPAGGILPGRVRHPAGAPPHPGTRGGGHAPGHWAAAAGLLQPGGGGPGGDARGAQDRGAAVWHGGQQLP